MQPTYLSSRILLPVRPGFVRFTLAVALALNFLPTSEWIGIPDWVALVVCFWGIREPRRVGMGWGFVLGLAMDVADGAMLGQHALAYVLLAYGATSLARRLLWFPLGQQALHILPLLVMVQVVQVAVRGIAGAQFPGIGYFVAPFVTAILWAPATYLLLLPQFQPVERDANRPI